MGAMTARRTQARDIRSLTRPARRRAGDRPPRGFPGRRGTPPEMRPVVSVAGVHFEPIGSGIHTFRRSGYENRITVVPLTAFAPLSDSISPSGFTTPRFGRRRIVRVRESNRSQTVGLTSFGRYKWQGSIPPSGFSTPRFGRRGKVRVRESNRSQTVGLTSFGRCDWQGSISPGTIRSSRLFVAE